MSLASRVEQWCGNVVLKNLKRPFVVALFTLLLVLFIIFSTISSGSALCERLLIIEHYTDTTIKSGTLIMPENLTIAYIGDTGKGASAKAVYQLVKDEGAELVVHTGDFDYDYDPAGFYAELNEVFGKHFPVLGVIGEHDVADWADIPGYQDYLMLKLRGIENITCSGSIGVNYWCIYRGLYLTFSGIGTICKTSTNLKALQYYITSDQALQFPFKICAWHKNQRSLQISSRVQDETGYEPYEMCRQEGAMIITGHSHCYARTHLLSDTISPLVESSSSPYTLSPGNTIVVANGLGGNSIDVINTGLAEMKYWGSTYCRNSNAEFGAFICKYNLDGDPNRALCYFKDIHGNIPDSFEVVVSN